MTTRFLWNKRSLFGLRPVPLSKLRDDVSALQARLREANAIPDEEASAFGRLVRTLDADAEHVFAIRTKTETALVKLGEACFAASEHFRLTQLTYGTIRKPLDRDGLRTLLFVMAFWLLEGGANGAVLISGGGVDVPVGLTLGLALAGVNSVLSLLVGYLGLRYLAYRKPYDVFDSENGGTRIDGAFLIRALAWAGTALGVSATATLIFCAGRIRALNGASDGGVFDFDTLGFWATYSDPMAIVITAIGAASSIWAVREGYCGFTDPIPGYAESHKAATSEIENAADELIEDAIEIIDGIVDAAIEKAEDRLDDLIASPEEAEADLLDLAHDTDAHNDTVVTAREAAKAAAQQKSSLLRFILGRGEGKSPAFDGSAFDALVLPKLDDLVTTRRAAHGSDAEPVRAAITRLETARMQTSADLRAALAGFAAATPNLDALFDNTEGGTRDDAA